MLRRQGSIKHTQEKWEQVSKEFRRFSDVKEWYKKFQSEDIHLLSSEEKEAFSEKFSEGLERVQQAFHPWKELHKNIRKESSENKMTRHSIIELAQWVSSYLQKAPKDNILAEATKNLDQALKEVELLKQEIEKKSEKNLEKLKNLDERFKATTMFYRKIAKQVMDEQDPDRKERLHQPQNPFQTLSDDYNRFSGEFKQLRCKVEKSYDTTTHFKLENCLKEIEEKVEDEIVKHLYPTILNTVSRETKKNTPRAEKVHNFCKTNNIEVKPSIIERLSQLQRETVRKNLLWPKDRPEGDRWPVGVPSWERGPKIPFQELEQFASNLRQAEKCCEMAQQIHSHVERLSNTGVQQGLNEAANTYDETWKSKFQHNTHDAILEAVEGTGRQAFKDLRQIVLDLYPDKKPVMEYHIRQFEESQTWMDEVREKYSNDIDSVLRNSDDLEGLRLDVALRDYEDCATKFEEISLNPDKIPLARRYVLERMVQSQERTLVRALNRPFYDQIKDKTNRDNPENQSFYTVHEKFVKNRFIPNKEEIRRYLQDKEIKAYRSLGKGDAFKEFEEARNNFTTRFEKIDKMTRQIHSCVEHLTNTGVQQGLNEAANTYDETWMSNFEQKLGDACLKAVQDTGEQAFKDLQQIVLDLRQTILDLYPDKKPVMEDHIRRFEESQDWMDQVKKKYSEAINSALRNPNHPEALALNYALRDYEKCATKFEEISLNPDKIPLARSYVVQTMVGSHERVVVRAINRSFYDQIKNKTDREDYEQDDYSIAESNFINYKIPDKAKIRQELQDKATKAYRSLVEESAFGKESAVKEYEEALDEFTQRFLHYEPPRSS